MYARAASAYRRVDLESAPKSEILARLFARCLADVAAARAAITAKDIPTKAATIDHALRIVVELRAALDHGAAPALAANLDGLYVFVQDQLTRANLRLDVTALDAAARVLRDLGDAFGQIKDLPTGPTPTSIVSSVP